MYRSYEVAFVAADHDKSNGIVSVLVPLAGSMLLTAPGIGVLMTVTESVRAGPVLPQPTEGVTVSVYVPGVVQVTSIALPVSDIVPPPDTFQVYVTPLALSTE